MKKKKRAKKERREENKNNMGKRKKKEKKKVHNKILPGEQIQSEYVSPCFSCLNEDEQPRGQPIGQRKNNVRWQSQQELQRLEQQCLFVDFFF